MPTGFFVADLHGRPSRYRALERALREGPPDALFLGGDLLPHTMDRSWSDRPEDLDFFLDYLNPLFTRLKDDLGHSYPQVFLILGNDDPRYHESTVLAGESAELWRYVHDKVVPWGPWEVAGYSCIPPSPFQLKDWERYDVSRFVDPGCLPPEEGRRSDDMELHQILHTTIAGELEELAKEVKDFRKLLFMSHCPPYDTVLDRAALDGQQVDHVPLDVHIGSIAIRRFLEARQPLLSLHGHVHESRSLTGAWKTSLNGTTAISAANDSPELALVRFNTEALSEATLDLIP